MHQVRYFLAVSRTLNFTRAAEECNVAQPSLSRAIKQLEAELGGELFRRERSLTHLTDLGRTVLPALRECYEASLSAKSLAQCYLKRGHAPLHLALSRSVEMDALAPVLEEVTRAFPSIEIKVFRGAAHEIAARLKSGDAEIAVAAPLEDGWERLDCRRLFREQFGLLMQRRHRLANIPSVDLDGLMDERLLCRPHCSMTEMLVARMKEHGADKVSKHEVPLVDDLADLVRASFGIGVLPVSRRLPADLKTGFVSGIDMTRWIHVYSVAGRQHTPAASALKSLLRARDWGPQPDHPAVAQGDRQ
jgi:DNA-binding transcriptional LysR family regulator